MIIVDNKKRSLDLRFDTNSECTDGNPRLIYIIKGLPTPLARARAVQQFTAFKPKLHFYNTQHDKMRFVGIDLENQHDTRPLYTGPLHLDITFHFRRHKSPLSQKKVSDYRFFHNSRPDLSNLIKFIEDVSNGILYKDDALISSCCAKKVYDVEDYTEFFILELDKVKKVANGK